MASPQTNPERHEPPRTLNHAVTMIVKLGFRAPSKEDMLAIRNVCGTDTLAKALADALNGENEESKALLSGVMGACAASTRQRLEAMGLPSLPTEVLAKIGKDEGVKFTQMVREATAGTPSSEVPRSYIALTLARYQDEFDTTMLSMSSGMSTVEYPAHPASTSPPAAQSHQELPTARQAQPEAASPEPAEAAPEDDEYKSAHVYGGSAALCFNVTLSRQKRPTISLDAALEIPGQARKYNWQDKITVQLSAQEMPLVYAVLMGYMDKFKGAGHGEANEKWFTIEKQQGKMFVSVNRKGSSPRGVPIAAGDLYLVTSLFMRQLQADAPHLSPSLINAMAQRAAFLYNETNNGGNKD